MNISTKQKQTHREQTHACLGGGRKKQDGAGVWGWQVQTIILRMDKQ